MILSAQTIRNRLRNRITPFNERRVFNGMSYGLSHAGYDLRIKDELVLWPTEFALATTIEELEFPNDILGMLKDKSSWARRGLSVFNTIFEPGWRGYPTIELANHGDQRLVIEAGAPIAQMIFHQVDQPTEKPYAGKYQDQPQEPVPAKDELLTE
jgi:dCTP deaminase